MAPKKAQKQEAPKPAAAASTAKAAPTGKPALSSRPSDWLFIFTYKIIALFVLVNFVTRCSHVLPEEFEGFKIKEPICSLPGLVGLDPEDFGTFMHAHEAWGNKIFKTNLDFSLKLANAVAFFFIGPVSVILAFGFFRGYQWVKNLGLIHAAICFYNMVITDVTVYQAVHNAEGKWAKEVAFIIYGYFTVFFLVVMYRLGGVMPFNRDACYPKRGYVMGLIMFIVKAIMFFWFAATLVAYYEFSITHIDALKDYPSAVEAAAEYQDVVEDLQKITTDYCSASGKLAYEYGSYGATEASRMAEEVGQQLLDFAKSLSEPKKEQ